MVAGDRRDLRQRPVAGGSRNAIWLDELGAAEDHPAPGEMQAVALDVPEAVKRHTLGAHRSQLGAGVFDDPAGFALTPARVARLTGPKETFWRPCPAP
jgi:hypothetical protein